MNKKAHSTAMVAGIFLLILGGMSLLNYLQYGSSVLQSGILYDIPIPQSVFWFTSFAATILTAIGLLANKRFCVAGWILRAVFAAAPTVLSILMLVFNAGLSRLGRLILPYISSLLTVVAMLLAARVCYRLFNKQKVSGAAMVVFAVLSVVVSLVLDISRGLPPAYAVRQVLNVSGILNLGVYILLALSGSKGDAQETAPAPQPQTQTPSQSQTPNLSGAELARAQEELAYYEDLARKGIVSEEDLAAKRRELGL